MKLFCSLPSPFARKVRALAAEKGIALELVVVDVLDPASPVAALNPLRKVPCLVTDDGDAWYDSPVICEWLDALPGPRLLPADFATRMAVKRVEALADGVMDAGVAIRLESIYAGRAEHERSAGWMDWQWLKVEGGVREPTYSNITSNGQSVSFRIPQSMTALLKERETKFQEIIRQGRTGTVTFSNVELPGEAGEAAEVK